MRIEATLACGHTVVVDPAAPEPPMCHDCQERRIARVKAPAPRIKGAASGPCVVKS